MANNHIPGLLNTYPILLAEENHHKKRIKLVQLNQGILQ